MKKEILTVFILVLSINFILAFNMELPPNPIQFYGEITYTNGTNIPDGYYLTTKIGSIINGQCEIINSSYNCKVYIPQSSSVRCESPQKCPVNFLLGEDMIVGYGSASEFDFLKLDLTTDSLPLKDLTKVSDGNCELRECSYNIVDCDASKTNKCSKNGRCDVEIGETCTFTPQDCGACASTGGSPLSSGGSPGGGSSPSSSTPSNTITQTSTESNDSNELSDLSIEKLNEKDEKTNSGLGITGGVIGFAKSGVGIGLIVLLAIALIIGVASVRKKINKKKK